MSLSVYPVHPKDPEFKRFIDNVALAGAKYILSCGTGNEEQYDAYFELMKQSADYAAERGVVLTLKPHGGISATSRELLQATERVDHPNFHIYYDPGNIHYYTGESAAEDVKLIAKQRILLEKGEKLARQGDAEQASLALKAATELGKDLLKRGESRIEQEAIVTRAKKSIQEQEKLLREVTTDQEEHLKRLYAEITRLNGLISAMESTKAWRLHRTVEKLRGRRQ